MTQPILHVCRFNGIRVLLCNCSLEGQRLLLIARLMMKCGMQAPTMVEAGKWGKADDKALLRAMADAQLKGVKEVPAGTLHFPRLL